MIYEIVYTRRAAGDLESLDPLLRRRLAKKLALLRGNPIGLARRLTDSRIGQYRYRVGDYRVVFDLHGSTIAVLRVGHRREIYR